VAEADQVFEQGMQEFENFLKGSLADGLPEFPRGLWGVNNSVN
jgi:hypothetical protein